MKSFKEKIRDLLVAKGIQFHDGLLNDAKNSNDLKKLLLAQNWLTETEFLGFLSQELEIPYIDIKKYTVSPENTSYIPEDIAFQYRVFPLSRLKNSLTIATANPLDVLTLDDIKLKLQVDLQLVLANETDILALLNKLYKKEETFSSLLAQASTDSDFNVAQDKSSEILASEGFDLLAESKTAPIVKIVDLFVYEALSKRASDIHIEPTEFVLKVRYRIDGLLQDAFDIPRKNQNAIFARLKIMSGLNITETKIPQDGRFKVKMQSREVDFRVSSLPTRYGEKFVLRALDKSNLSIGLDKLGFSDVPRQLFEAAVKKPFGIILVTGPTGSGKSTTLYSIVNYLNGADRHIVTIEDPVEYQIQGLTQIPVNAELGLTFAAALRAVLRQSPDIIMVGEIRDSETADIAIKASLTGELIFSTLHTNDSVGAIIRLADMGIEPFLLASSLLLTSAQRLCRRICPHCKNPSKPPEYLLKKLQIVQHDAVFFEGKGCVECNNTGYHGREALLEVLAIDDTIKEMIVRRKSEQDILEYARANLHFRSLREDGIEKCLRGVTTLEEILRVT